MSEFINIVWHGIAVEIHWQPDYNIIRSLGFHISHLELRTTPVGTPLPVTGTGYRSHFVYPDEVEAWGGPEDFVRAWLDAEARQPEWLLVEDGQRQPSLF